MSSRTVNRTITCTHCGTEAGYGAIVEAKPGEQSFYCLTCERHFIPAPQTETVRNKTNAQLQEIIAAAEAELRRREEEHNRQWINGEISLSEWLWGTPDALRADEV